MIKIEARPSLLSLASLGRCYRTRLTADIRLRYAPPKLPSATSFIRKTLGVIALRRLIRLYRVIDLIQFENLRITQISGNVLTQVCDD